MSFVSSPGQIRNVRNLQSCQEELIRAFIQGAVYCWIKNRSREYFAARDLFGGENYDWNGTPLYALFDKHRKAGKNNDDAVDSAAKDLGWLIKKTLHQDRRTFEISKEWTNTYRWIEGEG